MRDIDSYKNSGKLGGLAAAKTASIRKNLRIDNYNKNPKLCKFCDNIIIYLKRRNDFCNQSCSTTFNNKGIRRHGEAPNNCSYCNKITYNDKFCSHKCNSEFEWISTKSEMIKLGVDTSLGNYRCKKYLIELHDGKCQICNIHEWCGQPAPLVLDHINGNPYDNTLNNLRVICHNCNAQTPTFAGRNKGNGRFERAKRYKLEKEVMSDIKADVI